MSAGMSAAALAAPVALGCAVLAGWLAVTPAVRPSVVRRRGRTVPWLAPLAGGLLLLGVVAEPMVAVLVGLAVGIVLGALHLLRLRRRDRAMRETRTRVVEMCVALTAELGAGRPASAALDRAALDWPHLAPAARAAAAGGDVPVALRALAATPGAEALVPIAAAWQVSHRTGKGLADALARCASDLRATDRTRRVVEGELASARATARLLAALPLVPLAMGAGAGAAPWSFLLGHPAGIACLVGGLACEYVGLVWIEALARDVLGRAG